MKIAFQLKVHSGWTAGTVYLETLFQALKDTNPDVSIGILGCNGDVTNHSNFRNFADDVIVYPRIKRWTPAWLINSTGSRLLGRNLVHDHLLKRRQVNVIAFGEAPQGSKIPTLGWIPDFQHLHFPEFFSVDERRHRDSSFSDVAASSARVILLSESAKRDFQSFAPQYAHKARVLQPITAIPTTVYDVDPDSICEQYDLPRNFFYLPNQFWKHKNHMTVFQAVGRLKENGILVSLVCSGDSGDYRHPELFSELLLEISRLGIRDQVALLGVVPRDHVFQLMRQSICVLNPSLFEGYGMTVDEARSLGKPTLLSDIAAHREQNPLGAVFFSPLASEELADQMERMWREAEPGPNAEAEATSRRELPARMYKYAESFMAVVREVVN